MCNTMPGSYRDNNYYTQRNLESSQQHLALFEQLVLLLFCKLLSVLTNEGHCNQYKV